MNALLLLLATLAFQVATSSVIVQHQDALTFENNSEARVHPITIEEKDLAIIDGRRYYFSQLDANLYEAQMTCEEFGMDLVSFETQAESDSVYAYILVQGINTHYYTSGVSVNNKFKWSSTYLNYNNWGSNQPDVPADSQACILYANGLFYDDYCKNSLRFICEDKLSC